MTNSLDERLQAHERHERQRALTALLRHPLITATGPHGAVLPLIRRHARELRDWFARQTGWQLHVQTELARLAKTSSGDDGTRPAWVRTDEPFSRQRYVLLCLALAALQRLDRQTTLQRVAERVMQLAAEDEELQAAGFSFVLEGRRNRRDLVVVMRYLLELCLLQRLHGDEMAFVSGQGDVLYHIDRAVLAKLLACPLPPSSVVADDHQGRIEALSEPLLMEADEARRRRLRRRLVARLLDDPVVYFDELSAEENDYLRRARGVLLPQLEQATGLIAEVRAEGIALADPGGELTDVGLPQEGTDSHITLLVAEFLVDWPAQTGAKAVPLTEVERHLSDMQRTHGKHWRKDARAAGAQRMLAEQALRRLAALRLVTLDGDTVVPRPAIARFALLAPEQP